MIRPPPHPQQPSGHAGHPSHTGETRQGHGRGGEWVRARSSRGLIVSVSTTYIRA